MIDWFVQLINYLITGIGITLSWVLQIFPDTPFGEPAAPPGGINIGWITWLIDFPTMIIHASALTACVLLYYAIRVIARWIKLVRS